MLINLIRIRVVDDEIANANQLVMQKILQNVQIRSEIIGERLIVIVEIDARCNERFTLHLKLILDGEMSYWHIVLRLLGILVGENHILRLAMIELHPTEELVDDELVRTSIEIGNFFLDAHKVELAIGDGVVDEVNLALEMMRVLLELTLAVLSTHLKVHLRMHRADDQRHRIAAVHQLILLPKSRISVKITAQAHPRRQRIVKAIREIRQIFTYLPQIESVASAQKINYGENMIESLILRAIYDEHRDADDGYHDEEQLLVFSHLLTAFGTCENDELKRRK